MAELHDRMPVILEQQDWPTWLGEVEGDSVALLRPAPDGLLRVWPVEPCPRRYRNLGQRVTSRTRPLSRNMKNPPP
jgi:putative SOS response-associated peptidase YedK